MLSWCLRSAVYPAMPKHSMRLLLPRTQCSATHSSHTGEQQQQTLQQQRDAGTVSYADLHRAAYARAAAEQPAAAIEADQQQQQQQQQRQQQQQQHASKRAVKQQQQDSER
jgi:hypothetical protein